jgi:coenzyme F420-reducing hydrogenase beta subunit|tara:strand:+ start:146 stop:1519 length:1374 start_codon:yes stop_codon:yes gene_type:complete
MKQVKAKTLKATVIDNNFCSGCGVCTATKGSPFKMNLTKNGNFEPIVIDKELLDNNVVCPFGDHEHDETKIADEKFKNKKNISFDTQVGYYNKIYAGHVNKGSYRQKGSSGGSVSWLCNELLEKKIVDFVVHVKVSESKDLMYQYSISSNKEEVHNGAKSRYYPVSLEGVLEKIKEIEGKYLVVGVPCFIKGINLIRKQETVFQQRILLTAAIFCGHLKTTHYLESIINQFSLDKSEVESFDFRHKIEGRVASDYGTKISTKTGGEYTKLNTEIFGTNWGLGMFKLKACDYCDDVIGETADISFGDAWLPKYIDDYLGTNVIVTRNKIVDDLIGEAISSGDIVYEFLTPEELYESQAGGYRHRREGLKHRLAVAKVKKQWVPKKRVSPIKEANKNRRKIYENRMQLQQKSFHSVNYAKIDLLKKELSSLIETNQKLNKLTLLKRILLKIKREFKKTK